MITKQDIEHFIEKIPPAPKAVQSTLNFLQSGDIPKAAKAAEEDLALKSYLRTLVNKPIYGFKNEVKETAQIFMVLGVSGSTQTVYNYLLKTLSPKEWHFFALNEKLFEDLQTELTISWNKITDYLGVKEKDIKVAISLIPSAVVVCEALFNEHAKDIELIRGAKDIDLNTILIRLSGYSLFDIAAMIAKKWDMETIVADIIKAASGKIEQTASDAVNYGRWIHLLLFYTFSKPQFIDAGLNDFLEFQIDFVENIYENFSEVMEIGN